ncbi:DNA-binding domain-containing protein [Hyphobacterium marinum]|uniref:DNA-binding domain-containing protein n=1 Tax=Hyphobacterium marinum TaxID=3116574 RepID=A0ABU7LVE2_9PROT|nr:DNA-binding domain-containing protein [Hyphobacterium sp. Y6023]MEE2565522.1 DNA-binding domain-containing protein [Hyphobacterium sp. Y6023]
MPDTWQDLFASALVTGDASRIASRLSDPDAPGFAVYRNTVVRSAVDALGDAYPAVKRLLGDQRFSAVARAFWEAHPPRERTLSLYGEGFAAMLDHHDASSPYPWLPDVARIDRAWLESHHAADAPLLTLRNVQGVEPAALASLRVRLHPAVRVIASDFPAWSIWRTNREDETVRRVRLGEGGEIALIHRPAGEIRHRRLEQAEAGFLKALAAGETLEAAAAILTDPGQDPIQIFIRLLKEGLFARDTA